MRLLYGGVLVGCFVIEEEIIDIMYESKFFSRDSGVTKVEGGGGGDRIHTVGDYYHNDENYGGGYNRVHSSIRKNNN